MQRRRFVAWLTAATAAPLLRAGAQTRRKLGYLSGGLKGLNDANTLDLLKTNLRELGWRVGENLIVDERWADGNFADLPRLAEELVMQQPDILACTGSTEATALYAATKTIPIVFLQFAVDPVATGIVQRISRPGGNVTGFMLQPQFLWSKRIGFLVELLGRTPRRLAWIGNPGNVTTATSWADAQAAAMQVGSAIRRFDVSTVDQLNTAFNQLDDAEAVMVQYDFFTASEARRVAAHASRLRLPAVYENRLQVTSGGLMSYGADARDNYRQGALYVHRILNGAAPGELPIVQASKFELIVNLPAAKLIDLQVPSSILLNADEVIE